MSKKPKWRNPEMVDWLDHSRVTGGWRSQSELKPQAYTCRSVGWVVNESKTVLQLVPHFGDIKRADMETEGVMNIIKSAIVRRKKCRL